MCIQRPESQLSLTAGYGVNEQFARLAANHDGATRRESKASARGGPLASTAASRACRYCARVVGQFALGDDGGTQLADRAKIRDERNEVDLEQNRRHRVGKKPGGASRLVSLAPAECGTDAPRQSFRMRRVYLTLFSFRFSTRRTTSDPRLSANPPAFVWETSIALISTTFCCASPAPPRSAT